VLSLLIIVDRSICVCLVWLCVCARLQSVIKFYFAAADAAVDRVKTENTSPRVIKPVPDAKVFGNPPTGALDIEFDYPIPNDYEGLSYW
jgi:hypothetical protein